MVINFVSKNIQFYCRKTISILTKIINNFTTSEIRVSIVCLKFNIRTNNNFRMFPEIKHNLVKIVNTDLSL